MNLSVLIGIGRYEKKLIDRTLRKWSEARIIWKALKSLTSEEVPKPGVGLSLTCGKGPKNLSILFSKFKGLSEA